MRVNVYRGRASVVSSLLSLHMSNISDFRYSHKPGRIRQEMNGQKKINKLSIRLPAGGCGAKSLTEPQLSLKWATSHGKRVFEDFWPRKIQTSLLSYRS